MKSQRARYERKLSGVERYSMAINEIHRYNVDALIAGTGIIDPDDLRRAVITAADANPGVRVRLKSMLGFSKWVDSGIAPEVKVVDIAQWDFSSDEGADFLKQPFTPMAGGAIADVILVRTQDKVGVVFRNLHAALDGRGVMHWVQEVFRALRGRPLLGSDFSLADFEVAENFRDKLPPQPAKKNPDKKSENAASETTQIRYMPVVPPSATKDDDLQYMWRTVIIPKRITTILPKAAIYLGKYARRQGDGAVGFTVPVDYRGLRVDASATGNLTGYLRINVGLDDTPKTVMQQINQQIRDHVDCRLPLLAKPLRWVPVKLIVNKLKKNSDALLYTQNAELPTGGLVSMGYANLDDYSTPHFKCERGLGIPGSVGKMNIVAVNFSDSTYVTFSVPKNYNREGQIDRMIDEFVTEFSA
ncbi:MAG: hypothetical protein QM709_11535 [Spongiibacteraceae bacterium]